MYLDKISIAILSYMDTLAKRIQASRKLRKISQKELAEKIGVTAGAISQYESSVTEPTIKNLSKVAIELNVSFEWLATGRGEPDIEDFLLDLTKMYKKDDRLSLLLTDDQIKFLESYKKLPEDWQEKYQFILGATLNTLELSVEKS